MGTLAQPLEPAAPAAGGVAGAGIGTASGATSGTTGGTTTGANKASRRALGHLGTLRWLTLLSFNLVYVVVPLLLFERTRSLAIVGAAMAAEGVLRAVLALGVGVWARRMSARAGMGVACALRGLALAALAVLAALAEQQFTTALVALVALASTLFYIGHFFATLEQELRSATMGGHALAAQTVHRVAEVVAPPVAFAVAFAGQALLPGHGLLLGVAALAVVLHGLGFMAWFREDLPRAAQPPGLAAAWHHLRMQPALTRGLAASLVGFTFYGWAVLATPFALAGRSLGGIALDSAAGIALFKTLAAVVGVAGALLLGRWVARPGGLPKVTAAAVAAPLVFALGLAVTSDALAVALLSLVCALVLGLFTWQRRLRQQLAAPAHFAGVTCWCMAIECLHVTFVGLALMVDSPWLLGTMGSLALAWLLRGNTAR